MRRFVFILLVFLLVSCSEDRMLEMSLDYAGSNRGNLESVLTHYADDGEKLESAIFLISNMPHWFSWSDGGELDSIETLLHEVATIPDAWYFRDLSARDWSMFSYTNMPRVRDSHVMTSGMLISFIDDAHRQKEKRRWNKKLPDEDFRNYLLPYRIGDEKLSEWRTLYETRYGALLDSLYADGDDSLRAAEIISRVLDREGFKYNICAVWPHRKSTDLFDNAAGPCRDECDRKVYALRSAGIPCAIDTYFKSPETDTSHQWVVVRDNKTGKFIPLGNDMVSKRDSAVNDWRKKGKVYRGVAGFRSEMRPMIENTDGLTSVIRDYYIKDVSEEYFGENTLELDICNPERRQVMLGVFTPGGWKEIAFADKSGEEKAVFRNVEKGAIYIPLIADTRMKRPVACGMPVVFEQGGTVTVLSPEGEIEEMHLTRKLPYMPWLDGWFSKGVGGGYFELSETDDFRYSRKSGNFPDTLPSNYNMLYFPRTNTRFVRFTVPGEEEIGIGEIEIFSDSAATRKLSAKVVNEFDCYRHPENVTDGNLASFFYAPVECRSIVLQLDNVSGVEAIAFSPRNNDNYIMPGRRYRLMYYHSTASGWVEAQTVVSEGREIAVAGPAGAFYWLQDLSDRGNEQVFIWRNGKQMFVHDL